METKASKIFLILATLGGIIFLGGCKTHSSMTHETVRVDSIVCVDTIYKEGTEVRLDTTYVYDSHSEKYVIGSVDTVWNIRVDTVKLVTVRYEYRNGKETTTDSAGRIKVNDQKGAATEVRTVEKVVEKKDPALLIYAILGMAICGIGGFFIGKWK